MYDIEMQKKQIKRCFNKAVKNYEQAAIVQKIATEHLLSKLNDVPFPLPGREARSAGRGEDNFILDLGSGTGYSTRMLADVYSHSKIIGIDLAENMVHYANNLKTSTQYLCADFDMLPIQNDMVDLIFSSMALQWSLNFTATLSEWHRTLKPNGLLLLSMLSKNSLYELRNCFNDKACYINSFMTQDDITNKIANNGFIIKEQEVKIHKIFYNDFHSILHSIKNVGANHVIRSKQSCVLTKKSFLAAERHYQQYATGNKLPITYELCYIVAEAKK